MTPHELTRVNIFNVRAVANLKCLMREIFTVMEMSWFYYNNYTPVILCNLK